MAIAAINPRYEPSFLYRLEQIEAKEVITSEDDIPPYPTCDKQTVAKYITLYGWGKIEQSYRELITRFQSWIECNFDSLEAASNTELKSAATIANDNYEYLYKKIFGDEKFTLNADSFLEIALGSVRVDLCRVIELLNDDTIPLDERKQTCQELGLSLVKCTQGLIAEVQSNRMNLEIAKLGCSGLIQRLRSEKAKQIAIEFVQPYITPKNHTWEEHAVNRLINYVSNQMLLGLPYINDASCNDTEVKKIVTEAMELQYFIKVSLHLSPASIFQELVKTCMNAYQQALISSNMYPGQVYAESKLNSGEVYAQLELTTSSIATLVKGLRFDFLWLIQEIESENENDETCYQISLVNLRFQICQHLYYLLIKLDKEFKPKYEQWQLNRHYLDNIGTVVYDTLYLNDNMHFSVKEEKTGQLRGVNLNDLTRLPLKDISEQHLLFYLFSEAILNTTDIYAISYFYQNQIDAKELQEYKAQLTVLLIERINASEITSIVREKIYQCIAHEQEFNEYMLLYKLYQKNKLSLPLEVAFLEYNYRKAQDTESANLLNRAQYLPYLSLNTIELLYTKDEIKSKAANAIKHDQDDHLLPLLSPILFSMFKVNINGDPNCNVNLMQLCIVSNANRCLKAILPYFEKRLGELCQSQTCDPSLSLAINVHNKTAIRLLIIAGANINQKSSNGYTPLCWAANTKNEDIASHLLLSCLEADKKFEKIRNKEKKQELIQLAAQSPAILRLIYSELLTDELLTDEFDFVNS